MEKNDYSYKDIVTNLKKVGIKKGDIIFIHSNLGFFGKLKNANKPIEYGTMFKNAIFEVVGNEGTLIVPTFSYSFMNNQIFDINNTPSDCGIFSEIIRKDPESIRTNDPNFSVTVIGSNVDFFTKNLSNHSFGKNSFWDKLFKKNGKICNFNFDSASTFIHYVEKKIGVKYRFDKKFSGETTSMQKESWLSFVFDHDKEYNWPEFSKFHQKSVEQNIVNTSNLGKGQITCISVSDMYQLVEKELEKDPSFLIKGKKSN